MVTIVLEYSSTCTVFLSYSLLNLLCVCVCVCVCVFVCVFVTEYDHSGVLYTVEQIYTST